jgi:hypothetical protein
MMASGAHGERNGRAVLTERQVIDILLAEHGPGYYARAARAYGVDAAMIRRIVRGNSWRHLPRDKDWLLARARGAV